MAFETLSPKRLCCSETAIAIKNNSISSLIAVSQVDSICSNLDIALNAGLIKIGT